MFLDLRTVNISAATGLLGFSTIFLVLWGSDRRRGELLVMSVATALLAAGNFLVALRGLIPDYASILVANGLIAIATLMVWRAARIAGGRAPLLSIELVAFAGVSAMMLYFTYVEPSISVRVIFLSVFLSIVSFCAFAELSRQDPAERSPATKLLSACFLFSGVLFLVRAGVTLGQPPIEDYMRPGPLQVTMLIAPIAFYIAAALGFFWLTFERVATELRQRNLALEAAREAAARADRAKSAFLANMSHEIRTPMNGIIGCTDILLDMAPTPEQKPYLIMLRNAESLLLTIINDILDFSKIDTAQFTLEPAAVEIRSLVQGSVELVRAGAAEKGLALEIAVDPALSPWMTADPARLRQILLNLLGNAVKFTETGRIAVEVAAAGGDATPRVRFAVIDTGIGVPEERRHLLFRDFSQAHRSDRFGGTGLGLAICKRLVTAMGGEIGMDGEEGRGSRFWFELPLLVPEPTAPGDEADWGPAQSPGARILVAEDIRVNQVIIERLLTRAGHEVTVVDDGAAALRLIEGGEQRFDLILMDMRMPEMDGISATEAIRRLDGATRDIPIIGLTANATPEDAARCRAAGMNDHLTKPIDRPTLMRSVARWRTPGAGRSDRE